MEPIEAMEDEAAPEEVVPKVKEPGRKTEIDPETAEAFIAEKHIGERIKRLRLKKSMGLVELGRHTGLSASFLSQLETGRVVPTLRNLARIAMVFSKDLSYFFETERRRRPYLLLREPWLYGSRPPARSVLCGVYSDQEDDRRSSPRPPGLRISLPAGRGA
jgi:transcriptional regulator with XRE-family HTH domain